MYTLLDLYTKFKNYSYTIFILSLLLVLMYQAKQYNYLLFHISVEMFSVIIALCVFAFAWSTRRISHNGYFLFVGISLFFVAAIDFLHTLSYKGMPLFPMYDSNLPTQLWIASRYILALSMLIAPLFLMRKIDEKLTIVIFSLVTFLVLGSIYYWQVFPDSFIENQGLTQFKKISEYIISLLFLGSIGILWKLRERFDKYVLRLLIAVGVVNIFSELMFTLYADVYGYFNMLGHIGKIIAYYLIFKAIVEVGITKPYNLVFLELNQLDQRKDDFLRVVSHELKTPLTTIKSYSQILQKQLSKQKDHVNSDYLEQISNQVEKMNFLINDLLDVSRIESGKLSLHFTMFDLTELLQQIIRDFQTATKKHRLELKSNSVVMIFGDKDRLGQVVTNLLNNSIKYSPKGGEIIVSVKKDAQQVILRVQDFGFGISKDAQKYIFDKYYRTMQGEKQAQGLGLGLYIAKEIVKQHKGKIWVESDLNKGTIFYISLPQKK